MKKGKALKKGIMTATGIVGVGAIYGSIQISKNVLFPNTRDYNQSYKDEIDNGAFSESYFEALNKEEFYIPSKHGYNIHGFYFDQGSDKSIVIIHGITVNLWYSMKFVEIFRKRGYNVCVYDHRNHGLSGGTFTTLGHFESDDAVSVIEYVKEKAGDGIVGIHGESMGAGTGMMTLSKTDLVDFLIEDCGYNSIYEQLHVRLNDEYKLPDFPFLFLANQYLKIKYKLDIFSRSPIDSIRETHIPTLFIHGDSDKYVPTYMAKLLYEAKSDKKELVHFENTKHAASYDNHKEKYEHVINKFLDQYGF